MTPLQIVLLVLLSLLAGAVALFALSWYMTEKRAPKFTALGTGDASAQHGGSTSVNRMLRIRKAADGLTYGHVSPR